MTAPLAPSTLKKQHLIDPEICIRCNTCEATCPVGAVTHNDLNYVVDAEKCNYCMDCISPCPTGSIDNWRVVANPYSLDEQMGWSELPKPIEIAAASADAIEALESEVGALLAQAHEGTGGKPVAPPSAAKPSVNLYNRAKPAAATVRGNLRLTAAGSEHDVRHIILDFGQTAFPVLEGQSVGIVPPGTRADGKPHDIRLYSIASPRDGEKPGANSIALTVKREPDGVCSNYLAALKVGDGVQVTGPFGATFLLPESGQANLIMICTGTGSAPMRAFTERRRRVHPDGPGKLMLFFGARRPEDLPYFGPLKKLPASLITQHLVYSRLTNEPKEYVQDRLRREGDAVAGLLKSAETTIYICGLKGMETGVDEALADICRVHGLNWSALKPEMRGSGRYHVETY